MKISFEAYCHDHSGLEKILSHANQRAREGETHFLIRFTEEGFSEAYCLVNKDQLLKALLEGHEFKVIVRIYGYEEE